MSEKLKGRLKEFESMASDIGMTYFPVEFEIVPQEVMLEVTTYALPSRARHWVYGQSYDHQKSSGEMGHSKIYEVIMNNDPSYAFLLDTNDDVTNTMVMAHCLGHCLAPDTYIETSDGPKKIIDISAGDMVFTHTGELKKVLVSGKTGEHKKLIAIKVFGHDQIICTYQHPIYIRRDGVFSWVKASDVTEGDITGIPRNLAKSFDYDNLEGDFVLNKIEKISKIDSSRPQPVYNIEVEGDHSFVTSNGITTHNSSFFRNNHLFQSTDRKMVYHAAERAERIEEYIQKYGIDAIEHCMNMAFSMDRHIDWSKGENRKRYAQPKMVTKTLKANEFDDILNPNAPKKISYMENADFPPHSEYDLLWFAINYGNLNDWQKDVFEIIRQESFYFYPQYSTKVANEGLASLIHAEFMSNCTCLTAEEHMDFCRVHERVVQPGGNPLSINPYYLGFSILQDIRKRWDNYKSAGESAKTGMEKVLEVIADEDDISLIKNYLTKDLVDEMKLFAYKYEKEKSGDSYITIESREPDDVAEFLTKDMHNYRSPIISVERASTTSMELKHHHDGKTLDSRNLKKVMGYMHEIYGCQIDLETIDEQGEVVYHTYDEEGFSGE
jgi:stage V sporulation protein R